MLRKIKSKITFTYIAFAFLIISLVGIIISFEFEANIKISTEKNLLNEIDLLNYYLIDASNNDSSKIFSFLSSHASNTKIRITLIDSIGVVIYDSDVEFEKLEQLENHLSRPEIISAKINITGKDIRLSASTNHQYFYVAKKVATIKFTYRKKNIKYIRASISLENLQTTISEMRLNIFLAGVAVLIAVFGISGFISKKITKPIINIINDLNEIRSGNYRKKIVVKSKDELSLLASSVNHLVEKINSDIIELEKLSKIRSQFLANVSHELRTPLFTIQAYFETLVDEENTDSSVFKKYLNNSLKQIERLNNLLNDLIEISRIESGELKLSFRYFSFNDFISQIIENEKTFIIKKNMKVSFERSNDFKIFGDKERLSLVMINLIDNAIKYNPEGTAIKIYFKYDDSSCIIFIEDNGIGISEEHLPRIFERFYRVDKERSRLTGGTGLGLAIVKHILEAHNSKIEVESKVGTGTKFFFNLLYEK